MKEALIQVINAGYAMDCLLKKIIKSEIMILLQANIGVLGIEIEVLILSCLEIFL